MKKYIKPTVEVVSLKSSEHIAKTTFKDIRFNMVQKELYNSKYAVSQYAITSSDPNSREDS